MKYNKKKIICSIFIIISFTLLIVISSKNTKTFNYNGSIIALKVDGSDATSFPSKGKYNVNVNCENGKGVWNPKTWKLEITKITGTVTCDISFNSNASNLSDVVDSKGSSTTHGIRYQGKNPDNYVWYNDELWRIIGNVPVCLTGGCSSTENRVKLIRNNSIGSIAFYKASSPFTWMGSNIQNLLNTCYLGKSSSCDSYCYSHITYETAGTCDYSFDGIDTSDYYGNMIEDVYYNVGMPTTEEYVNADGQYTKETSSYASTTSKIGLMYASDWGYAIENFSGNLEGNNDVSLRSYMSKNWLFSNGNEWTMSIYSSALFLCSNSYYGNLGAGYAPEGHAIRPVLYLKSNVYVVSGTGTKVDPYRIGM